VGVVLISIGGLLLIVWAVRVMIRMEKVNRERVQRRRELWEAEGRIGPPPGDYIGRGGSATS
jgi:hypothetical protein